MLRPLLFCLLTLNIIYLAQTGELVYADGYQYYISYPLKLNWHNAFRHCTYQGMYLIDFHTEEEFKRVVRILLDHRNRLNITGYDVWTSGTGLGSKGQHYWETSGHSIRFTAWIPGEPNNWNNIQDCISIYEPSDFLMKDRECNISYAFVCRNKLVLADTLKNKHDACAVDLQIG